MNSYEFFDCVFEENKNALMKEALSPDSIVELFKKSVTRIDICSGEMNVFNNMELSEKLENVLDEKNGEVDVDVICGNRIIGLSNVENGKGENPFLKILLSKGYAKVYFNQHELIDQIANGYTHYIVIDGGKFIYLEEPHSYKKLKEQGSSKVRPRSLLIENDYDLGLELFQRRMSYIKFAQLPNADVKLIEESTFDEESFFQHDSDRALDFDGKEEFEQYRKEIMSKRLKNIDFDIENLKRFIDK